MSLAVVAAESLCDRQPVHIPGTIQPHGLLLVLPPGDADATTALAAVSANLELPADGVPPRLGTVLAQASVHAVASALRASELVEDPVLEGLVSQDGRRWTGLLRRGEAATLLELEPEPAPDPAAARHVLLDLNRAIAALRHQTDAASACRVACAQLRAVTGFDRVMAYRFMADWSGEVVAEALAPDGGIDSFRGLVFPASDIPAPARALYASNRLRLIPDVVAAPVPLLALGDAAADPPPVDLGRAVLRGVAPVHLQYLANMEVAASMSVAIATPAQPLWGLLACHHQQGPLFVDHLRRQAAETIAHALSWRLAELADAEATRRLAALRIAQAPFLATGDDGQTDPPPPPDEAAGRALLAACDVEGLVVMGAAACDGSAPGLRLGLLPPEPGLRKLVGWLELSQARRPLLTDRLGTLLPSEVAAGLGPDMPCGLLALPLDGHDAAGGWVLWFRSELRRQVSWAGHKPDHPDPTRPLTPRASFAAWREEVAGRSAAWPDWSLAAAAGFRDAVLASLARRSAGIARSNAELRRRNDEIRFFADAATHDLKEPLWQVQVLCGLIRDGLDELFGPAKAADSTRDPGRDPAREAVAREVADLELDTMAALIVTSAGRMRAMIDDLAQFAVAGRNPDRVDAVPLRRLAEEAIEDLGAALRAVPEASISLHGLGDVAGRGDAVQLRRLFQNLLSNAVKYRDPARPLTVSVAARRAGRRVWVTVADNGRGFDAADRQVLFEPFRRFRRADEGATDGLGLGLAICRRIAEAHGGTIEATPLSPGARFEIVLVDMEPDDAPASAVPEEVPVD